MLLWKGVLTPLVTPFTRDGEFDREGFRRNVEVQVRAGVHGLVALATAGEAPSLSLDERVEVMDAALEAAGGRIPVLVGVGGINERETYVLIRHAEEAGASGLFVITPYFYRFTRRELTAYFRRIADRTGLPIMIYNSTYADTPLNPDAVEQLADQVPNFVALKEGNQLQASEVIRRMGDRIGVFSARDAYMFELLAAGGAGAVSFAANVVPELVLTLYREAASGNWQAARALQHRLNPLIWELVRRSYPAPIKAAMNLVGMNGGHVRPPLTDLQPEELTALRAALESLDLVPASSQRPCDPA